MFGVRMLSDAATALTVALGAVWTQEQCDDALSADIQHAENELDANIPWWRSLDDVRQDAIVEMGFNMGVATLCEFVHALKYLQSGDFANASAAFLMSKWAGQVGERAQRLAHMIRYGARSTT